MGDKGKRGGPGKGHNPDQQWNPTGHGAGQLRKKSEPIPVPVPRRKLPFHVKEVAPLHHTYGQFTEGWGTFLEDEKVPPRGAPEGSYFDEESALHAVTKIQELYHFEGKWAGHHAYLSFFELRLIRYIFGWKGPDGLRLIRRVYLEIPRKSGKSTLSAVIAIYLAYWDGEPAPQVFFAAADKDQAGYTWNIARVMIQMSQELEQQSLVYQGVKKILIPDNQGELKALSGKSPKLYGLNLHGLVFDELMVQQTRELWDALTTAQGAREQPLIVAITTSGFRRNSIAYEQREYTRQIHEGILTDHTFLGVVYSLSEEEDWSLEENWYKAAPSLGYTIDIGYYQEKAKEALGQPTAQNSFRTLLLCQWVGQSTRVIVMADWNKCSELKVEEKALEGLQCFGGIDMSTTVSLTAFVLDFPHYPEPGWHTWKAWHFIPLEELRERGRQDRVDYQLWVDQGLIKGIPGSVVRDEYIRNVVREASEIYDIEDISFDRWGMAQLYSDLEDDGFTMAKMGQGYASMTQPTKELLRMIKMGTLVTMGNPVLTWQADNIAAVQDPAGNIKFDRLESGSRIDGMVAGVMALDGAMRRGREFVSVYEDGGPDDIWDDEKWKDAPEDDES